MSSVRLSSAEIGASPRSINDDCLIGFVYKFDLAILGIQRSGRLADFIVNEHLGTGQLVEVLGEYRPEAVPIYVVYPLSRKLSPAVRAFVDWVDKPPGSELIQASILRKE